MSPTLFAVIALSAILVVAVVAPLVSLVMSTKGRPIRVASDSQSACEGVEHTAPAHHTGTAR
jgi:hypothetical protein